MLVLPRRGKGPIVQWETATVFISSTFQDMHGERDYLVKEVFPELLAWCERRRIHLFDVDLRWGITEEDTQSHNTVGVCLHNIDRCRPFFVCFLGQRRGWVPDEQDISRATFDEYPKLPHLAGQYSITEMEIEHALLAPMERMYESALRQQAPCQRTLFFFRRDDYLKDVPPELRARYCDSPDNLDRIAEVKEVIRQGGYPVTEYDCAFESSSDGGRLGSFSAEGTSLGQVILKQLQEQIALEFPDHMAVSDDGSDGAAEMEFVWHEEQSYYPQHADLDGLHRYVESSRRSAYLVTGASGSGKTSLLCAFVREYQGAQRLLVRLCGISPSTSDLYMTFRSIMNECGLPIPATRQELYTHLSDCLAAIAAQGPTVLLIDALNQTHDGMRLLELLPQELPEGLKIILSCKSESLDDDVMHKMAAYGNAEIHPLQTGFSEEFKRGMIDRFLSQYLKHLDEDSIRLIVESAGSATPLFLSVILNELRVFGHFEEVQNQIARFGASTQAAFEELLARLERESVLIGTQPLSALLFGLLASSRRGLDEDELVSCIQRIGGVSPDDLHPSVRMFLRQLRPFLARRDRLYDFFHESFRTAASARYAGLEQRCHEALADYFGSAVDPLGNGSFSCETSRPFDEYPYHLQRSRRDARLHELLLQPTWIVRRMAVSGVPALLRDYEFAPDNQGCQLVGDALRLCAPVLQRDPAQLSAQLTGRLLPWRDRLNEIGKLLDDLASRERYCWFEPVNAALCTPGENGLAFRHGGAPIAAMCLHLDTLVVVDELNRLGVYDRALGMRKGLADAGEVFVRCLASDGNVLYAGCDDGSVVLWQTQILAVLRTVRLGQHAINSLAVVGDHLRAVDESGTVLDYDLTRNALVSQTKASSRPLLALACDGERMAYGGLEECATFWDGKQAKRFKTKSGYVGAVALSGDQMAYSTFYPRIFFRNLSTGMVTSTDYTDDQDLASYDADTRVDYLRKQGPYIRGLCFDNGRVVVATPISVAVFAWGAEKPSETLPCHDARALIVADNAIYVGDGGGLVRSYRIGATTDVRVEAAPSPLVSLVCDEEHIAALSENSVDWYGWQWRAGRMSLDHQGAQRPDDGPWFYTSLGIWKDGVISESLYSGYRVRLGWEGFGTQRGQEWLRWDSTDTKRDDYVTQHVSAGDYLIMRDFDGSLWYYHASGPLSKRRLQQHDGYPRRRIAWEGHTVTKLALWSETQVAMTTKEEPRSVHVLSLSGAPRVVASFPVAHEVSMLSAGPEGLLFTYGEDGSVSALRDDGSTALSFQTIPGARAMEVSLDFLSLGLPSGLLASYLLPEGTLASLVSTDAGICSLFSVDDIVFAGSESGRLMAFQQHRLPAAAPKRKEALDALEALAREESLPERARVIEPAVDKEGFRYARMVTFLAPMVFTAIAFIISKGWGEYLFAASDGFAPGSPLGWLLGLAILFGRTIFYLLFVLAYSLAADFYYEDERWRGTRVLQLLDRYGLPLLFSLITVCCILLTNTPYETGRLAVRLSCYLPLGFILAYFQLADATMLQKEYKSLIARENGFRTIRVTVFFITLVITLVLTVMALVRPDLIAAIPGIT